MAKTQTTPKKCSICGGEGKLGGWYGRNSHKCVKKEKVKA